MSLNSALIFDPKTPCPGLILARLIDLFSAELSRKIGPSHQIQLIRKMLSSRKNVQKYLRNLGAVITCSQVGVPGTELSEVVCRHSLRIKSIKGRPGGWGGYAREAIGAKSSSA